MYKVCAIKPVTGKVGTQDTVNDLNKIYDPTQESVETYLQNLPYVYDDAAMMYLYQAAFQQFLGENPMNIGEGIAWRNIAQYQFQSWGQLESILRSNYERAITDTNNKLTSTQLDYAGRLQEIQLLNIDGNTRILQVYVIISFDNIPITQTITTNVVILQPDWNNLKIMNILLHGK